jgi:hypothetical protein
MICCGRFWRKLFSSMVHAWQWRQRPLHSLHGIANQITTWRKRMADPVVPSSTVNTSNIFIVNGTSVARAANPGSFDTNVAIRLDATPRAHAGTSEILSDGPSAVVAGIEKGATNAVTSLPSISSAAGRIAPGAALVGGINDSINVGQHVVQGNGAEAVTEGLGAAGQAGGAAIGAKGGAALGTFEGMQSAASTKRLQHLEITGIADGKISVVFSSAKRLFAHSLAMAGLVFYAINAHAQPMPSRMQCSPVTPETKVPFIEVAQLPDISRDVAYFEGCSDLDNAWTPQSYPNPKYVPKRTPENQAPR